MANKRSTKDLSLSSNERLYLKDNHSFLFKRKKEKNFKSKYLDFYTFHAGFKKKLDDLLVIVFKELTPLSAVYSKTSTPSAPIIWDKKNNRGFCKLLIINAGNANAHTGKNGVKAIDKYVAAASKYFKCKKSQILVSSTGVIGEKLNVDKIIEIFPKISKSRPKNLLSASKAIMTTDTYPKNIVKKVKINSKVIKISGIAKGSGMIHPNMATMLSFIFTDANIPSVFLKSILKKVAATTFNSITVDGDTSTNDMVGIFSTGKAKNSKIYNVLDPKLQEFEKALHKVCLNLAKQIVVDGEGAKKFLTINVINAKSLGSAKNIAFSIANSPLLKTAVAGEDPNWGRIVMGIGKSGEIVDAKKLKIKIGGFVVAENGKVSESYDEKKLKEYMLWDSIEIEVNLKLGNDAFKCYTCDFTHDYIDINADYRN